MQPQQEHARHGAPPRRWRDELRSVVRLSLSLGFVHVGYHLTGFVDTALAGRVGGETLAATGLGSSLFFAISVFGIGAVMGLDPIIAQHVGAGKLDRAQRAMWQGIYAGGLVALPLSAIILVLGANLDIFGIEGSLADKTQSYLIGRVPSLWPLLAGASLRAYLQARHLTRPIVVAVIGFNAFNLVADWLLIFGDAGLLTLGLPAVGIPALGVAGVGWSSTIATVGQLLVLALAVRSLLPSGAGSGLWRLAPSTLRRILVIGAPLGLQLVAETGVFAMTGLLMGRLGAGALASHQVALQLASMTFAVTLGIGAATSVQVGRAIGREDAVGTRRAGLTGIGVGAAFMALAAITMWVWPEQLARVMTSDQEVIPHAASLLLIAAVFQVADGVQAVGAGALRGAGVTRWTFLANLVGHWCVGAPVGVGLAFGMQRGAEGLWWGLTGGLSAVAVALAVKFVRLTREPVACLIDEGG